jgi:hypothetical protein
MDPFKKHDLVVCKAMPNGPVGVVCRVSRKSGWADVYWQGMIMTRYQHWCKRMKLEALEMAKC